LGPETEISDTLPKSYVFVAAAGCGAPWSGIVTVIAAMKKAEIAKRMARRSGVSEAEAADRLDLVVHQILSKLRHGKEAPLPGFGKFTVGANGKVNFQREVEARHE
jgi:nucleoid DNA-binding protein